MHGGAPEVVEEDILEGRVRPEIAVILDRGYVVEDEATAEAVGVDDEGGRGDRCRAECSPRGHSHTYSHIIYNIIIFFPIILFRRLQRA